MSSPSDLPDSSDLLPSAVAADATVAHATEGSPHHSAGNSHCQNCGTPLRGPFCHRCGQHDFDVNRSFRHTFLEALESFFHFDTKLFRNLLTLLFCPGRLTAAFNAGKRASQVPPFRLYVFVSIFFFIFASMDSNSGKPPIFRSSTADGPNAAITIDGEGVTAQEAWQAIKAGSVNDPALQEKLQKLAEENKDAPSGEPRAVDELKAAADAFRDSHTPAKTEDTDGWGRIFAEKGRLLDTPEGQAEMLHGFVIALPKLILLCLPLFALYTRFLFRKTKQVYLQHLVLALHFHTFIYLWLMFEKGWEHLVGLVSPTAAGWIDSAGKIWMILYPLLMLHYVFANPWWKTLPKTFLLAIAYNITLGIGFIITAMIVLLTL